MVGPREPESSLPLYSPNFREGFFSETQFPAYPVFRTKSRHWGFLDAQ
jgi:hypothetical protein